MANELKGLGAGLIAGLAVVGASYGVSAALSRNAPAQAAASKQARGVAVLGPTGTATVGGTGGTQLVAAGRGLYVQNCVSCHGPEAQGQIGPPLIKLGDPDAKIARNIANGFPPKMPPYKDKLSSAQINTLVAYIQSLK